MKLKYLICAVAATMGLAGCQNDEFEGVEQNNAKAEMINTSDLNLVVSREEPETRVGFKEETDGLSYAWSSKVADKIGLVYYIAGQGGVTNYQFTLSNVWKGDGEPTGTETDDDNWTAVSEENEEPTLSKFAKFSTTNDQIMKGDYVAYFPFNQYYDEVGTLIPVTSPKEIEATVAEDGTNNSLEAAGNKAFYYGKPQALPAGKGATNIVMHPLASLIRVRLANYQKDELDIKTVVLRTHGDEVFTLNGKLKDPSADWSGSNIERGTNTGDSSNTLFVRFKSNNDGNNNITLDKETATEDESIRWTDVYFPVLPMTISQGLDVILINSNGMACVKSLDVAGTVPSGGRINLKVKVEATDTFDTAFVTNGNELLNAVYGTAKNGNVTVELLGDVTLAEETTSDVTTDKSWNKNVTINGGKGSTLTIEDYTIRNTYGYNNQWTTTEVCQTITVNTPMVLKGNVDLNCTMILNGDVDIEGTVKVGYNGLRNGSHNTSEQEAGQLQINGTLTVKENATLNAEWAKLGEGKPALGITIEQGGKLLIDKATTKGAKDGVFNNTSWFESENWKYKNDLVVKGELIVDGVLNDDGDTVIDGGAVTINGTARNHNTFTMKTGKLTINGKLINEDDITENSKTLYGSQSNIKIEGGTVTTNATGSVTNKSSFSNGATFINNGTYYDYLKGAYGGYEFEGEGTYACYVESQEQLEKGVERLMLYAENKDKLLMLLDNVDGTEDETQPYSLTVSDLENINVASAKESTSVSVTGEDGMNTYKVKSLTANGTALSIVGDLIIPTCETGLTVNAGTLTVDNNVTVKVYGGIVNKDTWVLTPASGGATAGTVYCTSWTNSGTYNTMPTIKKNGNF